MVNYSQTYDKLGINYGCFVSQDLKKIGRGHYWKFNINKREVTKNICDIFMAVIFLCSPRNSSNKDKNNLYEKSIYREKIVKVV